MTQDFSQHPRTLGDIRSEKSGSAKDCSARALCEHEWAFKTYCCVKCGAAWPDVVDKELRRK